MWNTIIGLIKEIKSCEAASAHMGALSLCYICIDTMALLGMPGNQTAQTRAEFIAWVEMYLKGHPSQPYQYRGLDVYAARCAVLHSFGAETELHRRYQDVKSFIYHNGGLHMYNPDVNQRLVIIGLASFINDVVIAVEQFMKVCENDAELRVRVEQRLPSVLANMPLPRS